jgi:hypothetical protein
MTRTCRSCARAVQETQHINELFHNIVSTALVKKKVDLEFAETDEDTPVSAIWTLVEREV